MSWLSRVRNVFRKEAVNSDIEDELRFHAEQRAADLGLTVAEAQRRLGNMLQLREQSRDVKLAVWLDSLLQDTRIAFRLWYRRPLIFFAAILTVALGAGLNLAVAQLLWSVVLRPIPYPDPDRLVQVWINDGKEHRTAPFNTVIEHWRDTSRSFEAVAAYRAWRVTMATGGEPEQVYTGLVSSEYFKALGAQPLLGRTFTPLEGTTGADSVALLRESYWRRRFGGDPAILDRIITIEGMPCRVIGIVPNTFSSLVLGTKLEVDVYLPLSHARVAGMRVPLRRSFVVGKLHASATPTAAQRELATLMLPEEKGRVWLSPLQAELGHQLRPALVALFAATGCVLFIAFANLANLLLAQAVVRRRDLALRAALGAGRGRVVRQLLTETALVLLAGNALGVALAASLLRAITAFYPDTLPRLTSSGPSWSLYAAAAVLTFVVGLLFGLLPAWRATGEASENHLRVSQLGLGRSSRRWAEALVALQVALTAVVLIGAGLLGRSFLALRDVDLGFAREHVLTASVDLPGARYKERTDRALFGAEWLARVQSLPGVSFAAISNSIPLRYTTLLDLLIHVPGKPEEQMVSGRAVSTGYFATLGIHFVAGGPFDDRRTDQVVVNEAFARKYLTGHSAVGTTLGAGTRLSTITGVIRDVRHIGLRDAATPELYLPFAQFPLNPVDTVIRSSLSPAQLEAALRHELRAADSQLALGTVLSMDAVITEQLARPRFQALLLGLFAAVALILAIVGSYGVIAHTVRSRRSEFGLRRALGATTPMLFRLVLIEGLRAPLAGLLVGLVVGAGALGRWIGSLLYGVEPRDWLVLGATAAVLVGASLLGCVLPGRTAVRVQPAQALRQE